MRYKLGPDDVTLAHNPAGQKSETDKKVAERKAKRARVGKSSAKKKEKQRTATRKAIKSAERKRKKAGSIEASGSESGPRWS